MCREFLSRARTLFPMFIYLCASVFLSFFLFFRSRAKVHKRNKVVRCGTEREREDNASLTPGRAYKKRVANEKFNRQLNRKKHWFLREVVGKRDCCCCTVAGGKLIVRVQIYVPYYNPKEMFNNT